MIQTKPNYPVFLYGVVFVIIIINMSKNKKKRNKIYTGPGAAMTKPVITKIEASNRSRIAQWIFERKKALKTGAVIFAIIAFVVVIIIEIIRALNGA